MPSERMERKKERTRQAIRLAAVALATEQDFRLVSLDDIADRADVARGTIYNLYERKDSLLVEIVSPLMIDMARQAEALAAQGAVPFDSLAAILAEAWSKDRGTLGLMLHLRGQSINALETDHRRLVNAFIAAFSSLDESLLLRTASPRDAALLLFRVAVPVLEAVDPSGGPGRGAFIQSMRGLFLAQPAKGA